MPREPDIIPGQAFHLPAAQDKNINNLLKIFGKKEATDALTEMAKVDKNTWGNIKDTVIGLKDFAIGGGISAIKDEIRQVLNEEVTGIMSPLLNEFQPLFSLFYEAIEPVLPLIQDVVKWVVDFLKPIIQWIADAIQGIIDFFTGGGPLFSGPLPSVFQDLIDAARGDDTPDSGDGSLTQEGILGGVEGPYGDY